jgi:hypothetical protein
VNYKLGMPQKQDENTNIQKVQLESKLKVTSGFATHEAVANQSGVDAYDVKIALDVSTVNTFIFE